MYQSDHHIAELDALEARISTVLRDVPGATELIVYGSRTSTYADRLSDIDMRLVVDKVAIDHSVWPAILTRAGAIDLAWAMSDGPDASAYTIVFRDRSLYHKLDVDLLAAADAARFRASVANTATLWTQPAAPPSTPLDPLANYIPPYGSVGHTALGELTSAVRYIKARKRGHTLVCWRFARSKLDMLIALWSEQARSWTTDQPHLGTWDYKGLDQRHVVPSERLHALLDWGSPAAMDRSIWHILTLTNTLFAEKAKERGEVIPTTLVERHMAFIREELAIPAFIS